MFIIQKKVVVVINYYYEGNAIFKPEGFYTFSLNIQMMSLTLLVVMLH